MWQGYVVQIYIYILFFFFIWGKERDCPNIFSFFQFLSSLSLPFLQFSLILFQKHKKKDGGDWNPYRLGQTTFFGPGSSFAIDSTRPMTVVTQFLTDDNTDNGDLIEIKRFYMVE